MGWIPPHTTLFVRRSIFEAYGLYNPTYRVSGDYDFMLRILMTGNLKFCYIPEVLIHMRSGGLSSQRYLATMKEDYRALKMNGVGGVFTQYLKYLRVLKQYYYAFRIRS
jgi:glycosyltransferase